MAAWVSATDAPSTDTPDSPEPTAAERHSAEQQIMADRRAKLDAMLAKAEGGFDARCCAG